MTKKSRDYRKQSRRLRARGLTREQLDVIVANFKSKLRPVSGEELQASRNPAYKYLIP